MANTKISEMQEALVVNNNDYIPIIQGGVNKKAQASLIGSGGGGVSGDTLPVGAMLPYSSTTLPANWLECNGQAVSREEYSLLFAVIGTTYGAGDGSTTFNLPDKRGKVSVGRNTSDTDFDTIGETGGEKTHTLTINEMPSHTHEVRDSNRREGLSTGSSGGSGNTRMVNSLPVSAYNIDDEHSIHAIKTGGSQPHNNLQPYQVDCWIIKAKQSAGVVANVVDNLNSDSATDALSAKQGKVLNEKIEQRITTGVEIATNEWIDNKRVYRKRIDCGYLPNTTTKQIPHGLTNFTLVKAPIGFASVVYSSTEKYTIPLPCVNLDGLAYSISITVTFTDVEIKSGSNRNTYSGYVDLYYTKD